MEPPKKRTLRKKKVGRPAFSRKDIPEEFFRYYDAYKYGFWNKREFADYLLVSRPTLDRYFKTIHAKPPLVSKAENKKLQAKYGIGDTLYDKLKFCDMLKALNGEKVGKSTGARGIAKQAEFYLKLRRYQEKYMEEHLYDDWEDD